METTTLYYKEGSSDKVYRVSLKPEGDGHVVLFAYGRRNSTLNAGQKTPKPLPYDQAKACYDGLIREKLAKGYQHGEPGTDYQPSRSYSQFTGILPQLLNPVDADGLSHLLDHPGFWMQEKHDGRRLLLQRRSDLVTGINRLGREVAVPMPLVEAARSSTHDFVIDGEAVGNNLCAFDLLELDGEDLRGVSYGQRYLKLMQVLAALKPPHLRLVKTAFLPDEKHRMLEDLKQQGKEGVVFKSCDAPYVPGRPSSGGPQLKHKFYETASFIVGRINEQRSVGLLLFEDDRIRRAGNVTIPPNHDLPISGQVVECRYLYAFRESGAIYQPVFLGVREDVLSAECITGQLKYKSEPCRQAA